MRFSTAILVSIFAALGLSSPLITKQDGQQPLSQGEILESSIDVTITVHVPGNTILEALSQQAAKCLSAGSPCTLRSNCCGYCRVPPGTCAQG
ncbi:hypothetical protein M3J09_005067 [Ascochyta lentis]